MGNTFFLEGQHSSCVFVWHFGCGSETVSFVRFFCVFVGEVYRPICRSYRQLVSVNRFMMLLFIDEIRSLYPHVGKWSSGTGVRGVQHKTTFDYSLFFVANLVSYQCMCCIGQLRLNHCVIEDYLRWSEIIGGVASLEYFNRVSINFQRAYQMLCQNYYGEFYRVTVYFVAQFTLFVSLPC